MEKLLHQKYKSFEILAIDEFAERLKVGKSTIVSWKSQGILVSGRHYFQRGKVVRFFWTMELISELNEKKEQNISESIAAILPTKPIQQIKPKKRTGINLDY